MNANVPSIRRFGNVFVNYVERMIPQHPLPWTPGPFENQFGLYSGKKLMVITDDYESARATANWVDEEFAPA